MLAIQGSTVYTTLAISSEEKFGPSTKRRKKPPTKIDKIFFKKKKKKTAGQTLFDQKRNNKLWKS
jgi:hypothetical protein